MTDLLKLKDAHTAPENIILYAGLDSRNPRCTIQTLIHSNKAAEILVGRTNAILCAPPDQDVAHRITEDSLSLPILDGEFEQELLPFDPRNQYSFLKVISPQPDTVTSIYGRPSPMCEQATLLYRRISDQTISETIREDRYPVVLGFHDLAHTKAVLDARSPDQQKEDLQLLEQMAKWRNQYLKDHLNFSPLDLVQRAYQELNPRKSELP